MSVLVDASIWSLALRRRTVGLSPDEREIVEEWRRLVRGRQAAIIGAIRQEVLSGVRHELDFQRLRNRLSAFADIAVRTGDYEQAAGFFNKCRAHGITGTAIDLLICAAAHRLKLTVFTTDPDFEHYSKHLPIRLHRPRGRQASGPI